MSIGNAIFQGIVQGLTEFLPVSSSGHLSLIQYFTGQGAEQGVLFTVMLHLGTLLAVLLAFWGTIWDLVKEFFALLRDIVTGKFTVKAVDGKRRMIFLLFVACLPLLITVLFKDWFESLATDQSILAEGICFLITSALLFLSDKCVKGRKNAATMQYRDAVAIGVAQAIAPLPGVSRSGSTIAMGLLAGLERKYAVAFSFILGVPAVLGANLLEIGKIAEEGLTIPIPALLAGMLCSLIFGILAIRLVRWLVVSDRFVWFAWYTLVLGIVVIAAAVFENMTGHLLQKIIMGT